MVELLQLWHVSHDPDIKKFVPRAPPVSAPGGGLPVVWAVASSHLENYLVARECPRVAIRSTVNTSASDHLQFFGASTAEVILYIEASWLIAANQTIWRYEMPQQTFECVDANAGYYVSKVAVIPTSVMEIEHPLAELVSRNVELRVVPRLRPIAEAVAASSLSFSIIRLNNAATT